MDREQLLHAIETDEVLDRVAERITPLAQKIAGDGARKDALSGTWLGHPVHPMVMVVPLGCFVSATTLDLLGGATGRRAARRLIGVGLLGAVPTVATGLSDWIDTQGAERRMGTVHALTNAVSLGLFATSWRQRGRGDTGRGVLTSLLAASLSGAAGYLGGHLAYRRGVGVDTTAFQHGPTSWRSIGRLDELAEDRPLAVTVDDLPLVVVRRGSQVHALAARCTHRGGPLNDGTLDGGCVTCPWHGSSFDLASGAVESGPATAPQPAYEVRVVDGRVEVRRDEPGSLRQGSIGTEVAST